MGVWSFPSVIHGYNVPRLRQSTRRLLKATSREENVSTQGRRTHSQGCYNSTILFAEIYFFLIIRRSQPADLADNVGGASIRPKLEYEYIGCIIPAQVLETERHGSKPEMGFQLATCRYVFARCRYSTSPMQHGNDYIL